MAVTRQFKPNPATATRKRVQQGAAVALEVATEIGKEFRIFQNMSFFGRVLWLLTGRITVSAKTRRLLKDTLAEEAAE